MGIFGSSFNPPHLAHIHLLIQAQKIFHLDLIKVVPVYQHPLNEKALEASPEKRLSIVRKIFKKYDFIEVDDQEIKRGGVSYAIETIKNFSHKYEELFVIIGIDQLMILDKWKDFESILKTAHFIVCHRKDFEWKQNSFPKKIQRYIKLFQKNKAVLKTGKQIFFLRLKDFDMSSSEIRQRIQADLPVDHLIPSVVGQWIKKHNLYKTPESDFMEQLLVFSGNVLLNKKAEKIRCFDLRQYLHFPFQFTLVASGLNTRHTKILARELHKEIKKQFSFCTIHTEGQQNGQWIVLDYGFLVVHIFYHYTREYYSLESLWKGSPMRAFSP